MSVKPEKVSELFDFRRSARAVLDIEKQAIDGLYQYLDETFERACEMVLCCAGKIVVTGMGKSGHVGNKIAATLASTGTPAFCARLCSTWTVTMRRKLRWRPSAPSAATAAATL